MKDEGLYLEPIERCISRLDEIRPGAREAFAQNWRIQDAVYREQQTMSEATQRLSDTLKDRYPDIPWRQIIGMRNVLTHGYLSGPDDDIVWRVIEDDLDALRQCIAGSCTSQTGGGDIATTAIPPTGPFTPAPNKPARARKAAAPKPAAPRRARRAPEPPPGAA
jgi:uncharacterized protein with HEPN domain